MRIGSSTGKNKKQTNKTQPSKQTKKPNSKQQQQQNHKLSERDVDAPRLLGVTSITVSKELKPSAV